MKISTAVLIIFYKLKYIQIPQAKQVYNVKIMGFCYKPLIKLKTMD